MRATANSGTIVTTLLLIIPFLFLGCASTSNLERSDEARTSLDALDRTVGAATSELQETRTSLDNLMRQSSGNLGEAFDSYAQNVTEMVELENAFIEQSERVRNSWNAYIEEWEESSSDYSNQDIQRRSEQRRQELQSAVEQVSQRSSDVRESFRKYTEDLREIRDYLSNDLTSTGIDNIDPIADDVLDEGETLMTALERIQDEISDAREVISD